MMTDRTFGIEIEAVGPTRDQVVDALRAAGVACNIASYGSRTEPHWKVQTDGSVQITHRNQGNGTFEVVSPILRGEQGLAEVNKVCAALATINTRVNRTCGLHVHFGIRDLSHEQIKKVCKRWVRDEKYIDLVMPQSRRGNNNTYCMSNAAPVSRYGGGPIHNRTVEEMFEAISRSRSFTQLQNLLCPNGRYHKLNLLAFAEHGTIEFRQHSGTVEGKKICYWIEFLDSLIAEAIASRSIRTWADARMDRRTPVRQVHRLMRCAGVTIECLRFFEDRAETFQSLYVPPASVPEDAPARRLPPRRPRRNREIPVSPAVQQGAVEAAEAFVATRPIFPLVEDTNRYPERPNVPSEPVRWVGRPEDFNPIRR